MADLHISTSRANLSIISGRKPAQVVSLAQMRALRELPTYLKGGRI